MNLSEIVRKVSKELNISGIELARRSGQSPQNLSKKLVKGTLSYEEFEQLMELMGAKIDLSYTLPGNESEEVKLYDRHVMDQLTILEKQLEVERLKSKYFTDMSFEFRTALETVSGSVQLALKHSSCEDRVRAYLNRLYPALDSLTRLVDDNPFNREAGISIAQGENYDREGEPVFDGKNVLLVDDNDLNREIVKEILEGSGMKVKEAPNGRQAVSMVRDQKGDKFDFVLMDIQMPVLNGFEATKKIRALQDEERAKTPVIAMTASVTYEDRQKAEEYGMNGFIEKPLDLKKLAAVICK